MKINGKKFLVCGAGGFIGGHLVKDLLESGALEVRAVDIKPLNEWYQRTPGALNLTLDLQDKANCYQAAAGVDAVFQLAADMGGMGFIENNRALCMLSVLINTHMLIASKDLGVERFLYASSACVYNGEKQVSADVIPLKEEDAYPALPEDGYGWEKLFSERMCRHFRRGLRPAVPGAPAFTTSMAPTVPGTADARKLRPRSAARCSKPKTPAATKSKFGATASQTRSFMYIDDCIKGVKAIFAKRDP